MMMATKIKKAVCQQKKYKILQNRKQRSLIALTHIRYKEQMNKIQITTCYYYFVVVAVVDRIPFLDYFLYSFDCSFPCSYYFPFLAFVSVVVVAFPSVRNPFDSCPFVAIVVVVASILVVAFPLPFVGCPYPSDSSPYSYFAVAVATVCSFPYCFPLPIRQNQTNQVSLGHMRT